MTAFNKEKQTIEQRKLRARLNAFEGLLCTVTPSRFQMELICLIALMNEYLRDPNFIVSDLEENLMNRYPKSYSWDAFKKAFDKYRVILRETGNEVLFQLTEKSQVA
jgi:hypothetical protein